ncbi:MAG: DNA double-strand break repair nuclease NurA, partial [bacterium]
MPYEGEFAGYRALRRITETGRVQQLLRRAQVYTPGASGPTITPSAPPRAEEPLPEFIVAIDGSSQEVAVKTGYPGAQVGYLTVASVLLDLGAIDRL